MLEKLINSFLLPERKEITDIEIGNISYINDQFRSLFPSFDVYLAVLSGSHRHVVFGQYNEGNNSPAFSFRETNEGLTFGFRFDSVKLREKVNSLTSYESRINISNKKISYNDIDVFLKTAIELDEFSERLNGGCKYFFENYPMNKPLYREKETFTENKEDGYSYTKVRKGQASFKIKLLKKYNSTCLISNCQIIPLIQAAHIIPHKEEVNYSIDNGFLLRADLHLLFDNNLLYINNNGSVDLDNSIKGDPTYGKYQGIKIRSWDALSKQLKLNLCSRQKNDK